METMWKNKNMETKNQTFGLQNSQLLVNKLNGLEACCFINNKKPPSFLGEKNTPPPPLKWFKKRIESNFIMRESENHSCLSFGSVEFEMKI